jgi:hypothetical protein
MRKIVTTRGLVAMTGLAACAADTMSGTTATRPAAAPASGIPASGTGFNMQGLGDAPVASVGSVPGGGARGAATSGTGFGMQGQGDAPLAGASSVPGGGARGAATSGTGFGMQGGGDAPVDARTVPGSPRR